MGLKSGVDLKRGTSRLLTLPKRKIRDGPRVLVYPGTRCNQQVCDATLNLSSQRSSPQAATGLRRLAAIILLGVQRVRSVREGHAKGSRMHGDAMQWLSRSNNCSRILMKPSLLSPYSTDIAQPATPTNNAAILGFACSELG